MRIYVRCEGRMANMILSWANARYVTRKLKDCQLLIDYLPIRHQCTMPHTFNVDVDAKEWPQLHTAELTTCKDDCVWLDAWYDFPSKEILKQYLDEITFSPEINRELHKFTKEHHYIGVHVRYGDYVSIDPENPPVVMPPFVRAPQYYYLARIDAALKRCPGCEIFLASDGTPEELAWFYERYPNALKHEQNNPLLDLLTLSRAESIVGSNSTFSSLAALIGGKPCCYPNLNLVNRVQAISKAP